ncbi:MAG: hypothetical protein FWC72_06525, partial [Oscillospiraceae bacterium]|nr:hypothetical protein [Oscillospiraceae bacterium]
MREKRPKSTVRWREIVLGLSLLVLAISAMLIQGHITGLLPSERAADRWSAGRARFAQVTVYLPEHHGLSPGLVRNIAGAIGGGLQELGITPDELGGTW